MSSFDPLHWPYVNDVVKEMTEPRHHRDPKRRAPDSTTVVRGLLGPGEKVLWAGKPRAGLRYEREDVIQALLSVPLLIVAWYVVREAFATRDIRREGIGAVSNATLVWIIAGAVLLVLIALYRIVIKHLRDAWIRSRTVYGLTDRRVIVYDRRFSWLPRSAALEPVASIDIEPHRDGSGTIVCRSDAGGWLYPVRDRYAKGVQRLRYIDDPETVRALIAAAQADLAAHPRAESWSFTAFQMRLLLNSKETLLWSGEDRRRSRLPLSCPVYGVTDQRAIRLDFTNPFVPVRSMALTDILSISVTKHRDGAGSIMLVEAAPEPAPDDDSKPPEDFTFRKIGNHEQVASLVREARSAALARQKHNARSRMNVQLRFLLDPGEVLLWAGEPAAGGHSYTTLFGLTARRAIVVEQFLTRSVRSIPFDSIVGASVTLFPDGVGTVRCISNAPDWLTRFGGDEAVDGALFYDIEDAGHIFSLLLGALEDAGMDIEREGD